MGDHSHAHGHDHGAALADHRGRLAAVLAITVTVMIVEVVGAIVSGSLALLADAAHMLTDVAGLTMGLVAASLARRPATPLRTWGYHRAEILGRPRRRPSSSRSALSCSSKACGGCSSLRRSPRARWSSSASSGSSATRSAW